MSPESTREKFIPYTKVEIIQMICEEEEWREEEKKEFQSFSQILESLYHFQFHQKMEALKNSYHPFNPDKDTKSDRDYSSDYLEKCEGELVSKFEEVLLNANYKQITQEQLENSLERESLFEVSLYVDFDDFEKQLLFWRGDATYKTTVKKMFFKKEEIEVPTFQRVAMLVKFKNEEHFQNKKRRDIIFEPGSMIIKLFKNIPKDDLEMLFPNTQVGMKLKDKLLIWIPAALGGIGILGTKGLAIIAAVPVLFLVFRALLSNGDFAQVSSTQMALLLGAGTALGAILGYAWRQWDKYKNRKIKFMKVLSENLYFKNLDNNAGVFSHLIDTAEEEEVKEAILAYYFLLHNKEPLSEEQLDKEVETWFWEKYGTNLDFEVDDALKKLCELDLCKVEEKENIKFYQVLSLPEACKRVDFLWDNFFPYNDGIK